MKIITIGGGSGKLPFSNVFEKWEVKPCLKIASNWNTWGMKFRLCILWFREFVIHIRELSMQKDSQMECACVHRGK